MTTTMMGSEAPLYAVCYDISDDRERRRVDSTLKEFGFRVQKSVFECRFTRADKARVVGMIESLDLKTGHVRFYRVYAGAKRSVLGEPPAEPDAVYAYSI